MMSTDGNVAAREYSSSRNETASVPAPSPLLFLLPGLIDDDPEFDSVWLPLRKTLKIVGVRYLDWCALVAPDASIVSLISYVSDQIKRNAPSGPILIAGYSIGGRIGYAVALALQQEGRSVNCLAILDASANTEQGKVPLSMQTRNRFRSLMKFHLRGAISSVIAKVLTRPEFWPLLRRLAPYREKPLPFDMHIYLHPKLTMQMELRLFRPWWPTMKNSGSLLAAPTYIFRSEDYDNFTSENLGWEDYCLHHKTIRVAGDHGSMLHKDKKGPMLAVISDIMTRAAERQPQG